jgi:hypothetical protein
MSTLQTLVVKIGADTAELQQKLSEAEHRTGSFGDTVQSAIGKGAVTAFAAAAAGAAALGGSLAAALKIGIDEAASWQEGLAQLDARLKSTGGAAGVSADEITTLAESMQKTTRYSDEAILGAANLALTFTNIKANIFPDVIRAAADMSTALGQDLTSSVMQLGKALQDPITGMTALRRVGVAFTDQQEEMVKQLIASGNGLEAQKMILRELNTEFGGSAQAAAQTFSGQLDVIRNTINELLKGFGTALLPGLQEVAKSLLDAFNDPQVVAGVEGLAEGISSALVPAIKDFSSYLRTDAISDLKDFGGILMDVLGKINAFVQGWKEGIGIIQSLMDKLGTAMGQEWGHELAASFAGPMGVTAPEGMSIDRYRAAMDLIAKRQQETLDKMLGDYGLGGGIAGGKYKPTSVFKATGYNFSMPEIGAGRHAAGIGTAATSLSMAFPDVLARAFGNLGEAQAWMGAFAGQHGGREPGVTDVRDMMASRLFAQKYGRAPTQGEWEQRYYKGSFEGVDETGLNDLFGKPGTWATLISEKAKQEAETQKALLDAFDKQLSAADTTNQLLADIRNKITPAGPGGGGGTGDTGTLGSKTPRGFSED